MSTASRSTPQPPEVPELPNGDRMSREEFHRIYEKMPEDFKAELIGGIVYVASPLSLRHGTNHLPLRTLLFAYEEHTQDVQSGDNATVILGDEGEPQPDLFLRILPAYGGQSRTSAEDYVFWAPLSSLRRSLTARDPSISTLNFRTTRVTGSRNTWLSASRND